MLFNLPNNKLKAFCTLNVLFPLTIGAFFILIFTSCEKVIDINLNDAAKKYVIEGVVTNEPGFSQVKISQTVNFSDANNFPLISGAIVTLKDNNSAPVPLTETSPGIYQTNAINGAVGHIYTLSVTINGQLFTATSQIPPQVNFDSLYVEDFPGFGDPSKLANVIYRDPPGKGNAYRFVQYKNGRENKSIFILNDDFSDGRVNSPVLWFFDDDEVDEIKINDTIRVEMQCVDQGVYKYWYSLDQSSTGSTQGASPGNPVSNIIGGALGYFSAHTVQRRTVIVQ